MVHVRICPIGHRGKATTEFYKDDKPQIYCYGFVNSYNDEPLPECKACADWAYGEQCEKDYDMEIRSREYERSKTLYL